MSRNSARGAVGDLTGPERPVADGAPAELEGYRRPVAPIGFATLAPIVAVVVALIVTIPVFAALDYGRAGYESIALGYPGSITSTLAAVLTAVATASSWLVFGTIIVLLFLLATPRRRRSLLGEPELRVARIAAGVWMCAAGLLVVVDAADINGQPIERIFEPGALSYLIAASDLPKAWIVTFVLAALTFLILGFAETWTGLLAPLWCVVIGMLAPIVVGQILVGANHDFGSDLGAIAAIARPALFGVAAALAVRVASGRLLRPVTLVRSFWFLSAAWLVLAATEVGLAFFTLAGPAEGNPTGLLVAVRAVVLVAAGVVLAWAFAARARLTASRIGLALMSFVVIGATYLGVTLAMEQIPPPHYFTSSSIMTVFFGFELTEAPSAWVFFTTWRPNVLLAVISVAAIAVYLVAFARVRRSGVAWPVGRVVAWVTGWVVVIVSTSSGLGLYAGSDFGVHMIVHMGLNMLAPILLVMGGVVTLLLRATVAHRPDQPAGPHEWLTAILGWRVLHVLYSPLVVFALFVGSYYALYLTGLFETIIRFHWAHQAMNLHFLIVGYLYYSLVIGVDRPPRPLPPLGKLGFVLAAMPFHAFFGVILMMAATPIAENFYQTLDAPWQPDLMASQYVGGGVAWAGGELPLLIVIIALGIQWARQDRTEARRRDRHFDTGMDDEFEEYNRMLDELAQRDGTRAAARDASARASDGDRA